MEQRSYEQRGYLLEDFRLFHLAGPIDERMDWHYHTFHKLIVHLSGQSAYGIEGRTYPLQPGDVVLIAQGCIHRPEAEPKAAHERMILYISPDFLRRSSTPDCQLEEIFEQAKSDFRFVVRLERSGKELMQLLAALERTQNEDGYGRSLLARSLLFEFLIGLRRRMQARDLEYVQEAVSDEKIAAILRYLTDHLTQELSIDDLASRFYISKYHMMRRFRAETGCTIHAYLISKRLILARELIAGGTPVTDACYACGFHDYSAFSRAYRKQYGQAPSEALDAKQKNVFSGSRKNT